MGLIERLQLELEDIKQDFFYISLDIPNCRVGDFGCGDGIITLGLMIHLQAIECVGIDKFLGNYVSPSLQTVINNHNEIKNYIQTMKIDPNDNNVLYRIRILIDNGYWPFFQQKDIVSGNNFPKNLDIAYSKCLLTNILGGGYDNKIMGEKGVILALNNIVGSIKSGGIFCLIEKVDFSKYLEHKNLVLVKRDVIEREVIGPSGRIQPKYGLPLPCYYMYVCKKL